MRIEFKTGVDFRGTLAPTLLAYDCAKECWRDHFPDLSFVVTEFGGSSHGFKSEHYQGAALDFRTRHVLARFTGTGERLLEEFKADLIERLNGKGVPVRERQFDVLIETNPPHGHVEWQPKKQPGT